ncbi:MAG: hypothetical protein RLP14_06885 [Owenweeksia sp.]
MENLYQEVPLYRRSLLQKIFRQQPEENAIIEINNLLATQPLSKIRKTDIIAIAAKYRVDLLKTYPQNLREFYAVYLTSCLKDYNLSDAEKKELEHLRMILMLSKEEAEEIYAEVAEPIYRKVLSEAVSDGELSEEELSNLESLQLQLGLSDQQAARISESVRGSFIKEKLHGAIDDQRFSPDEEKELELIAKNLGVQLQMDAASSEMLERYKLYWAIENGELPMIESGINLQRNEECYFTTFVEWSEMRTVTKRINYGGPTARIRIMKGVYYRMGSISTQRVTSEEWRHIDSGQLYLTNKRIIFMGTKRNANIRLNRILAFSPYQDGVEIEKDAGRNPFFSFNEDIELFSMLLSRVLGES